jgi:hypothetical protein
MCLIEFILNFGVIVWVYAGRPGRVAQRVGEFLTRSLHILHQIRNYFWEAIDDNFIATETQRLMS